MFNKLVKLTLALAITITTIASSNVMAATSKDSTSIEDICPYCDMEDCTYDEDESCDFMAPIQRAPIPTDDFFN